MTKGRFDTFTVGISCSHPPPLQIISFFRLQPAVVCAVLSGKSFAPVNCPESSSQICRSWFLTKLLKMAAISFVRGGDGEGCSTAVGENLHFNSRAFFKVFSLKSKEGDGLQYSSWRESIFQQQDICLKSFL